MKMNVTTEVKLNKFLHAFTQLLESDNLRIEFRDTIEETTIIITKNKRSVKNNGYTQSDLNFEIADVLKKLGVTPKISGYNYLRQAVLICIENEGKPLRISKDIYPVIATKEGKTPAAIERGIRHAIGNIYKKGNIKEMKKIFGNNMKEDQLSNSDFIFTLADKFLLKISQ